MNAGATAYEHKTLSTGTTGTDFNISHSANSTVLNIPDASTTNRGLVTTLAQIFAGIKTFLSQIIISATTNQFVL